MELAYIVVLLLYLVLTILPVKIAQKRTRSAQDYVFAGGGMGLWLCIALIIGQWVGGITVIGCSQRAYSEGISAGWFAITIAFGIILAGLLVTKIRGRKIISVTELITQKYGETAGTAVNFALLLSFLIALSVQITAGGSVLSVVFPELPIQMLMLTTALLITLYVYLGGMWATGTVNVVNVIAKCAGLILATILELSSIGGFATLQQKLPPRYFSLTGVGGTTLISWIITSAVAVIANQSQFQIIKSVVDDKTARRGCFIGAVLIVPFGMLAAILGTIAAAKFPNITSLTALPYLIVSTLHPLVGGLLITGLWAATLSTGASILLGLSTLVTKVFYDIDKAINEKESLRMMRLSTLTTSVIASFLALTIGDVLNGIVIANTFRIPIAIGIVLALYFAHKRGSYKPVVLSIIASIVLGAVSIPLKLDPLAPALTLVASLLIYAMIR